MVSDIQLEISEEQRDIKLFVDGVDIMPKLRCSHISFEIAPNNTSEIKMTIIGVPTSLTITKEEMLAILDQRAEEITSFRKIITVA